MNSPDSFSLILNQIASELKDVNDTLALIGLYYTTNMVLKSAFRLICYAKTYLLPLAISNENWLRSLGSWAIITGCTTGIGYGYARELAKRKINLILIVMMAQGSMLLVHKVKK